MKISIVSGFFLPVPALQGGAMEKIWHRFGRLFAAAGHEVTLLSRRWPGLPNDAVADGVRFLRLPGANHTRSLPLNLLLDLRWSIRVARALPSGDAVITNAVALPVFLRRLKPRAGHVCVSLGRMPKGQIRFYGDASCLLAPSAAVVARVLHEAPALADRVLLLPNPIDWPVHAAAADHKFEPARAPTSPLVIGYVGRINPEKGLEQLLDAAALLATQTGLPDWRVRLIGPVSVAQGGGGEAYRDTLLARHPLLANQHLELLPPVFDPAELARHYAAIDVFCYPSLAASGEGLSVAPLEAMAAGAVPVLSRLDCYNDILTSGENGCSFDHTAPPDRVAVELAGHFSRLLRAGPERLRLGRAAQQTARRFDYAVQAESVLGRLAALASAPSARG